MEYKKYDEDKIAERIFQLIKDKFPDEAAQKNDDDSVYYFVYSLFLYINENNGKSKSAVLNYLLSLKDEEINWFLRNQSNFYEYDNLEGPAKGFVAGIIGKKEKWNADRESYLSNEKTYNQTAPINFEMGQLVPMTKQDRDFLVETIKADSVSLSFLSSLNFFNRQTRAMFTIKRDDAIIGYMGFSQIEWLMVAETNNTYNIEYYICPQYRKQHFAKKALESLLKAAFNGEIIVYKDGDDYFNERYEYFAVTLEFRLIKSLIEPDNLASIGLSKSVGFKEYGSVFYIDKENKAHELKNLLLFK